MRAGHRRDFCKPNKTTCPAAESQTSAHQLLPARARDSSPSAPRAQELGRSPSLRMRHAPPPGRKARPPSLKLLCYWLAVGYLRTSLPAFSLFRAARGRVHTALFLVSVSWGARCHPTPRARASRPVGRRGGRRGCAGRSGLLASGRSTWRPPGRWGSRSLLCLVPGSGGCWQGAGKVLVRLTEIDSELPGTF